MKSGTNIKDNIIITQEKSQECLNELIEKGKIRFSNSSKLEELTEHLKDKKEEEHRSNLLKCVPLVYGITADKLSDEPDDIIMKITSVKRDIYSHFSISTYGLKIFRQYRDSVKKYMVSKKSDVLKKLGISTKLELSDENIKTIFFNRAVNKNRIIDIIKYIKKDNNISNTTLLSIGGLSPHLYSRAFDFIILKLNGSSYYSSSYNKVQNAINKSVKHGSNSYDSALSHAVEGSGIHIHFQISETNNIYVAERAIYSSRRSTIVDKYITDPTIGMYDRIDTTLGQDKVKYLTPQSKVELDKLLEAMMIATININRNTEENK